MINSLDVVKPVIFLENFIELEKLHVQVKDRLTKQCADKENLRHLS